jgi:prophage regulatory protein
MTNTIQIIPTIQTDDKLIRLPEVLEIIPVGRSTWWAWVATGKAPKGIKLGEKMTAWRNSDIQKLLHEISAGA